MDKLNNNSFDYLCGDCGIVATHMTCIRRFGERATQEAYTLSTMHTGMCDICGKQKSVTEARDFFYPSPRACKLLKQYLQRGKL